MPFGSHYHIITILGLNEPNGELFSDLIKKIKKLVLMTSI